MWQVLLSVTLVQVCATLSMLALTPITPEVAADLKVSPATIGYQISLVYAVGMFSSAAAGTLIDRYGAVHIEQFALLTFCLGLLGFALAQPATLLLASAVVGIGYGLQNPASSQILAQVVPLQRRNLVFSIKQAGVPLGAVFASIGLPLLLPLCGWRMALVLVSVIPLLLILLLVSTHTKTNFTPSSRRSMLENFIHEQKLIWRNQALATLALLGMLYSSVQLCLSAFLVTMLVFDEKLPLVTAGAITAIMQAFGAFGRVFWGVVADRTGSGIMVLAAVGFSSALLLCGFPYLIQLPLPLQVLLLCLLGMCANGWNGVLIAEGAHRCDTHDAGRVIGGLLVYTFIGVALGPSGFAMIYRELGHYTSVFAVSSALSGLGGLLALRLLCRR
ncbi:MAG: MFS transporter [Pseudomonas sp.]